MTTPNAKPIETATATATNPEKGAMSVREAGRKGGLVTKARYGEEGYYEALARKGGLKSGKSKHHRLRCPGCGYTFMNADSRGAVPCPRECGYNGSCVRITNDGHPKNNRLAPTTNWTMEVWKANGHVVKQIHITPERVTVYLDKDASRPVIFKRPPGGPKNIEYEYE
jgi:hypothetical protein